MALSRSIRDLEGGEAADDAAALVASPFLYKSSRTTGFTVRPDLEVVCAG